MTRANVWLPYFLVGCVYCLHEFGLLAEVDTLRMGILLNVVKNLLRKRFL